MKQQLCQRVRGHEIVGCVFHAVNLEDHREPQGFVGVARGACKQEVEGSGARMGGGASVSHEGRSGDAIKRKILNGERRDKMFANAPKMGVGGFAAGVEVGLELDSKNGFKKLCGPLENFWLETLGINLDEIGAREMPFGHEAVELSHWNRPNPDRARDIRADGVGGFCGRQEARGGGIGGYEQLPFPVLIAQPHDVIKLPLALQWGNDFSDRIESVNLKVLAKVQPARADSAVNTNVDENERGGKQPRLDYGLGEVWGGVVDEIHDGAEMIAVVGSSKNNGAWNDGQ